MKPNHTPFVEGWDLLRPVRQYGAVQHWICRAKARSQQQGRTEEFRAEILMESTSRELEYFERRLALAELLPRGASDRVVESRFEIGCPFQVYQLEAGGPLVDWLANRAGYCSHLDLVRVARKLLQLLQALHELGYVHGKLTSAAVAVNRRDELRFLDLARCEPIGRPCHRSELGASNGAREAPERNQPVFEANSAQDIYSVTWILAELLGRKFMDSPIAAAMLRPDPQHRPCAGELVPLFVDLERSIREQRGRAA